MDVRNLTPDLAVSPQVMPDEVASLGGIGYRAIICNRPDGESPGQPGVDEIAVAGRAAGIDVRYLPVTPGKVGDDDATAFAALVAELPKPILAYCRTGTRSATLWALSSATARPLPDIVGRAAAAGYDLSGVARRLANGGRTPTDTAEHRHAVIIVGGGAAGIATASSLLARAPDLDIAIVEPADVHYYQPGWTLVGAGVFRPESTARTMASVIPRGVTWHKAAAAAFEPADHAVILEGGRVLRYDQLVVCPGLKLDWQAIPGLAESLGRHGVTSNYRYDLAPYTWERIQALTRAGGGRAVFTQPPMPIKCAGAPQKAMYLAADAWRRAGVLDRVDIEFCNAGAVLFGVPDYVPALMEYVERYGIDLAFGENLIAVDGPAGVATFRRNGPDGTTGTVERRFDLLHAVPPQVAPDFIRVSPLADAAGWVDVDPATLRHRRYPVIFGLGDVTNTPNAKTAAAARKQAPIVAHNLLATRRAMASAGGGPAFGAPGAGADPDQAAMAGRAGVAATADAAEVADEVIYDGYGSCPLTVERGRIVLAEFGYGGKVSPSFPRWMIDGTRPSRLAWWLKERVLPPLYWRGMLKGREWLARPREPGAGAGAGAGAGRPPR